MSNIGREHIIEVPGLPAELQATAKEDIGRLLDAIAGVADRQGKQFLLDRVCLSDRFEEDVNRFLDDRSGLKGMSLPGAMPTRLARPFGLAPSKGTSVLW